MTSLQQNLRWESLATLQLYPPGAVTHRIKVSADSRYDAFAQDLLTNRYGAFAFNSLSDVAANQPASFTRTLRAPTARGGEWNAYVAAGDLWRASPNWQVIYGLRAEANAFTSRPMFDPALVSTLGVRNDHAPNTFALSPRFGVNWQDGHGRVARAGIGQFRNILDASLLSGPSTSTGLSNGTVRIACVGSAVPVPDWAA